MKKAAFLLTASLLAPVASHALTHNYQDVQGLLSGVTGDYDTNGNFVVVSVMLYGDYEGHTWRQRVLCPDAGCPAFPGNACIHASGDSVNGVLWAEAFTVLPRSDCY
jgi:hypothetical protein